MIGDSILCLPLLESSNGIMADKKHISVVDFDFFWYIQCPMCYLLLHFPFCIDSCALIIVSSGFSSFFGGKESLPPAGYLDELTLKSCKCSIF